MEISNEDKAFKKQNMRRWAALKSQLLSRPARTSENDIWPAHGLAAPSPSFQIRDAPVLSVTSFEKS